jgi:hypothetical protein
MSSEIKVDTISENTSANGVTIDGVKLKDNVVTVQGTSTTGGIIEIENTDTSGANGDFIGKINFKGNDSSGGASGTRAAIEAKVVSNFGSTELHFKTAGSGASATDAMIIDSAGHITKPLQPAFLVSPSDAAAQNNISGSTVITFGDEIFDQNADFASNTFTAPVTGRYQLNASLRIGGLDADATYHFFQIETSNRNYQWIIDPRAFDADPVYWPATWSALADMDANDTAYIKYYQSGGADQLDIETGGSFFSGFLAC